MCVESTVHAIAAQEILYDPIVQTVIQIHNVRIYDKLNTFRVLNCNAARNVCGFYY